MISRLLSSLALTAALVGAYAWPTEAQSLSVRIVTVTNPATRGADWSLTVQTDPGAECRAKARTPRGQKPSTSGPSGATPSPAGATKSGGKTLALASQVADARGTVTWKTRLDAQALRGPAHVTVQCTRGDRKGQAEARFEVR